MDDWLQAEKELLQDEAIDEDAAEMFGQPDQRMVSRKRAPDNILPRAIIKLPLRDGNQPSIKLEGVIFRVEIP